MTTRIQSQTLAYGATVGPVLPGNAVRLRSLCRVQPTCHDGRVKAHENAVSPRRSTSWTALSLAWSELSCVGHWLTSACRTGDT